MARATLGVVLVEAKSPLARDGHGVDPGHVADVPGAGARWARIDVHLDRARSRPGDADASGAPGERGRADDDGVFDALVATTLALLRGEVDICFTKRPPDPHDLTDRQWALVAGLLPGPTGRGPRWSDHRLIVDGLRYRERTGSAWREVPARYGPWRTLYGRHRRWSEDGTWARVTRALRER